LVARGFVAADFLTIVPPGGGRVAASVPGRHSAVGGEGHARSLSSGG
jgi:hypothetical protein